MIAKKNLEIFERLGQGEFATVGPGEQVYRGRLKKSVNQYPPNTEVAIKVQHPGIWQTVCIDFYIMAKIAGFLEAIPGLNLAYLSLVDTVRQFRDIMVRTNPFMRLLRSLCCRELT